MAGGEAQALDARRPPPRSSSRSEARTPAQVASVGVHVLAQAAWSRLHAGSRVPRRRPRPRTSSSTRRDVLAPPHVGHDAVRCRSCRSRMVMGTQAAQGVARAPVGRSVEESRPAAIANAADALLAVGTRPLHAGRGSDPRECGCRRRRPDAAGRSVQDLLAVALADAAAHGHDAAPQGRAGAQSATLLAGTPPGRRACVSAASRTQQVRKTTMSAFSMFSDRVAPAASSMPRNARRRACSSGIRTCGRRRSGR